MSGNYLTSIPIDAGADLTAAQYKAVAVDGTIAASPTAAHGILQNKPDNGEDATVGVAGRSRYWAGGAITNGARLTVTTSGWITAANTTQFGVGNAMGAVSSGGIGEGFFNFAGVKTSIESSHLI